MAASTLLPKGLDIHLEIQKAHNSVCADCFILGMFQFKQTTFSLLKETAPATSNTFVFNSTNLKQMISKLQHREAEAGSYSLLSPSRCFLQPQDSFSITCSQDGKELIQARWSAFRLSGIRLCRNMQHSCPLSWRMENLNPDEPECDLGK